MLIVGVPLTIGDSVNCRSLTSCPAFVGFTSRSESVIVNVPGDVVKMAWASTLPLAVVLPVGVT